MARCRVPCGIILEPFADHLYSRVDYIQGCREASQSGGLFRPFSGLIRVRVELLSESNGFSHACWRRQRSPGRRRNAPAIWGTLFGQFLGPFLVNFGHPFWSILGTLFGQFWAPFLVNFGRPFWSILGTLLGQFVFAFWIHFGTFGGTILSRFRLHVLVKMGVEIGPTWASGRNP